MPKIVLRPCTQISTVRKFLSFFSKLCLRNWLHMFGQCSTIHNSCSVFVCSSSTTALDSILLSLSLSLFSLARSPSFYLPCKVFVYYSYPHTLSPSHSPLCSRVAGHLIRNHVHMCTFSEIKLLSTRRLRFVRSIVNTPIDRQYLFWLA